MNRPNVLIVDDDPLVFEGLRRRLRRHPFALLSAVDGADALRVIGVNDVDVVVSDENMPTMPGLVLLSTLASDHPEITRVMMTGNARPSVAIGAINRARVFRFLVKPFDALDLARVLEDALAHRRRKRAEARVLALADEQVQALRSLRGEGPREVLAAPSSATQQVPDVLASLDPSTRGTLTNRQEELLRKLAIGLRVNDIAAELGISRHTVRNHLRSIFAKLGVRSQQQLLAKLAGITGSA